MSYGGHPYGGVAYAGSDVAEIPQDQTDPILAVEIAFTTGALETPAWETVTQDVRSWAVSRGRNRELERFQPGRATVVLSNLSRQYDSVYASGPHFGGIKPMRRIRIRETFNGVTYPVFDGFVDRWQLDYPNVGKDATATVTATDAFKVLARTDLGRSVYFNEVIADSPVLYYPMDETLNGPDSATLTALNHGTLGPSADRPYLGPPIRMGDLPLVTNDPGGSIFTNQDTLGETVFLQMGIEVPAATFDLFDDGAFVLEAWVRPQEDPPGGVLDDYSVFSDGDASQMNLLYDESASTFVFAVANDAAETFIATSAVAQRVKRHHVVGRFVSGQTLQLWVDGVLTQSAVTTGTFTTSDDLQIANVTSPGNNNWSGNFAHASVYTGSAATVVNQAWVDRHYAAGNAPWQSDLPGVRLGRVLDIAEWPSEAREIEDGVTTLQSAEITSQSVLEHSQKIAESEFGLLFIDRAGNVRFVSRSGVFGRSPGPTVYGDDTGQVGYREFTPDDGDQVIRNRATISRLNGVAQTAVDATSVDEFGRFDYVLDGLLHDSDSYSATYAQFIVDEYKDPRRRITSLTLGPAIDGEEDTVYPAMLGRELGDAILVESNPVGGGDPFEQTCVIEGIRIGGTPKVLSATFTLSPELAEEEF